MTDSWSYLRRFTQARVALGAAGHGLPTRAHLDFCEAHAAARDAVRARWSSGAFAAELTHSGVPALLVSSCAESREVYLRRPDLGRRLSASSREQLAECGKRAETRVVVLVTEGLSALAIERHGQSLLAALLPALTAAKLLPFQLVLAELGRVALGDEVGELLRAELTLVLLGERPGLSASDGIGAYLTYAPRLGRTDAERNCVSNIRPPDGLDIPSAVAKIVYLASEAHRRQLSGVALKDESITQLT